MKKKFNTMKFQTITYPDVGNGVGCRVVLWIQGCTHHCHNCQNPQTWDFHKGRDFTKEYKEKLFNILSLPYIKGLTLSGGDPLDSFEDTLSLVKEIKEMFPDKDIWLYTGYTFEEILKSNKSDILPFIDYIVDGTYKEELKDTTLAFRGSSNQIIWENKDGEFVKSSLN